MPELPEVETVCRGLSGPLTGTVLRGVEVRRPDLRQPFPPRFAQRLEGQKVLSVRRRAKYIVIDLDGQDSWLIHLGMSGRMVIDRPETDKERPHDHVVFSTDTGHRIRYHDPRRFGMMDLTPTANLSCHPALAGLGPEPLEDAFTPASLASQLTGCRSPIKTALLDQAVVAGLGNIYVAEALFIAKIHPTRPAGSLTKAETARLVQGIKHVLSAAIAAGGSSLRDYVQTDGELGYFQTQWAVYGREAEACLACKTPVQRIQQGGRSSFFCPKCQRK
jgi:formamidopyrimidine-DNA glycosylase